MNLSIDLVLLILLIFIILDLLIFMKILINKLKQKQKIIDDKNIIDYLKENYIEKKQKYKIGDIKEKNSKTTKITKNRLMEQYFNIRERVLLYSQTKKEIDEYIEVKKVSNKYIKQLRSFSKYKRAYAAVCLGGLDSEITERALKNALIKEKNYRVKLYMINSLCILNYKSAISSIVESVVGAPKWFRERVNVLVSEFGEDLNQHLFTLKDREEFEIKELFFYFASIYPSQNLKDYLLNSISQLMNDEYNYYPEKQKKELLYTALESLSVFYYEILDNPLYYKNEDENIKKIAIKTLSKVSSRENLIKLTTLLDGTEIDKDIIIAINEIINSNKRLIDLIINLLNNETNVFIRNGLCVTLSYYMDYLLLKLYTNEESNLHTIIKEIVLLKRNSNIIVFLNNNKNIELENKIVSIIREAGRENEEIYTDYCYYLEPRILEKLDKEKCYVSSSKRDSQFEKNKIITLYSLLIFIFLIFPVIYILRHYNIIFAKTFLQQIKIYIVDFNYYLIYYSFAINLIYFGLLILSFRGVSTQIKNWKLKKRGFLFKEKMLPTISIIAPAFNEEATIIESINSLLNLVYPDYELIVVNDGSKDKTLNTLIDYFNLEKQDYIIDYKINTRPIRGVYKNKSYPKLVVIDKENGGKADSLNTGINISAKEYFCGIDADSLLESDALLKIASLVLDDSKEAVALGGNIFPINGCTVDKGYISTINIPKKPIARFQMIEYIRAFMAGRIGWAKINSLLIISGAFGVFKKDRVIEIGGYLTSSGKYRKDTVGEDMELVVRLSRHMREKKLKYRIDYSFNANCWTEVPEEYKSLRSQRNRWHRGLIDILTFHKKMILNPRYGRAGMVSMPYFFIFEMMGPLVEVQGYLMVLLAGIFGLLNIKIALLLFLSTVLQGIFISMSSLFIGERELSYISLKELVILVFYSIIENFGFRQIVSLWRFFGYISSLKGNGSWGKIERKGFANNS
ncbi:glycosyltransferase family 2 protein [Clostridium sp. DL1XJH146]